MRNILFQAIKAKCDYFLTVDYGYNLRWFTPTIEVPLCGHATLVSAHILWEQNFTAENEEIRFYTRSGHLTAKKTANGWYHNKYCVAWSE